MKVYERTIGVYGDLVFIHEGTQYNVINIRLYNKNLVLTIDKNQVLDDLTDPIGIIIVPYVVDECNV